MQEEQEEVKADRVGGSSEASRGNEARQRLDGIAHRASIRYS